MVCWLELSVQEKWYYVDAGRAYLSVRQTWFYVESGRATSLLKRQPIAGRERVRSVCNVCSVEIGCRF